MIIQVRCLAQFWYHDKSKLVKEEGKFFFFYLIQFCKIGILCEVTLRRYSTSSPEPQEKMGSPLSKREEARRGSIKVF